MIKNSLQYGGILCLVAVVCTLMVSSLHVVVDPIIAERTAQKVRDNLNKIFHDTEFTYADVSAEFELEDSDPIDGLYKVTLDNGSNYYVYELSPEGRNDEIVFLIAYSSEGAVRQLEYVQMRETKGRGDKITKDEYLDRIKAQNASEMKVDMITGATYSSKAMKQGIEMSSQHLIGKVLQ